MKNIYSKNNNPFAGKKLVNFKSVFTYPQSGNIRFQIQLDKNGQIVDLVQSFATIIKDDETKKRTVKVSLGDRPKELFDHVHGRPFKVAEPWIDDYIETIKNL